jgi:DnaJ-class molecular chaperone
MSLSLWVEMNKVKGKAEEENCPYCLGNGEILCALCFGTGINAQNSNENCSCCDGRGLITCVNCKGDGRSMPLVIPSKKDERTPATPGI